jgi:hypothetical protein
MAEPDRATVELFKDQETGARTGRAWLDPCAMGATGAGLQKKITTEYAGESYWLAVVGIGDPRYGAARDAHVASGRPAACWDMGYFGKTKEVERCYCRVSLCADHPSDADIETTEPDPRRWQAHGLWLRDEYDPRGPIIVVGMGPKSHEYIDDDDWEIRTLRETAARFPHREVWYRPKPLRHNFVPVAWPRVMPEMPIAKALRGAALVVCRHSNVAVDACIAGVPVECESGATHWLYSRHPRPTPAQREDFLRRLARWQYRLYDRDMERGWQFLLSRWQMKERALQSSGVSSRTTQTIEANA